MEIILELLRNLSVEINNINDEEELLLIAKKLANIREDIDNKLITINY